jgi:hypothetical protein
MAEMIENTNSLPAGSLDRHMVFRIVSRAKSGSPFELYGDQVGGGKGGKHYEIKG